MIFGDDFVDNLLSALGFLRGEEEQFKSRYRILQRSKYANLASNFVFSNFTRVVHACDLPAI